MKIVNRKKFIRSVSITLGLILFLILVFANYSFSHTEVSFKKVVVSSGDTLWSLAKYEKINNPYFEEDDVRNIIDIIKITNNLENSNLKVGDVLTIPTI